MENMFASNPLKQALMIAYIARKTNKSIKTEVSPFSESSCNTLLNSESAQLHTQRSCVDYPASAYYRACDAPQCIETSLAERTK